MVVELKPCPSSLKTIQPYLKVASEHDERDPVISYWCRLYSLQTALTIDKKSDEAKAFLMSLMVWLEQTKKTMNANESITSEIAAQAYIENYALKLFVWADNMDRSGNFNKNVIRTFYSSGLLMDLLNIFGEVNEDVINNRKYAKWKAAYINNCLKNGETPVSGPVYTETDEEKELKELLDGYSTKSTSVSDAPSSNDFNLSDLDVKSNTVIGTKPSSQLPAPPDSNLSHNPYPSYASESSQPFSISSTNATSTEKGKLDPTQIAKAQKYCKFASSALNYDDVSEAISNLTKALTLLQTGKED